MCTFGCVCEYNYWQRGCLALSGWDYICHLGPFERKEKEELELMPWYIIMRVE